MVNVLYNVGSKHEEPHKTGFAHLFEHLMFGGSVNVPNYDAPLQQAGGENNAFTNHDFTNYYLTLPYSNIETGFWLESDRMLGLAFDPQSLEVQRNVVIEEFNERYFNQPYGDVWLNLLPLAYTTHPYSWATIGKEIDHIRNANMDDVKSFFDRYYHPGNAILVIAGNISLEEAKRLTEKWFGPIPGKNTPVANYKAEPKQQEARHQIVYADVPADLLVMAYKMCGRLDPEYYTTDLIADILGAGKSARLYKALVKENPLFSELDVYISGDLEPGLLVIEGKLLPGVSAKDAENAIHAELRIFVEQGASKEELEKVQNKTETSLRFNNLNVLNKAMKLAQGALLGEPDLVNTELSSYLSIKLSDIQMVSKKLFVSDSCSTLYYLRKEANHA